MIRIVWMQLSCKFWFVFVNAPSISVFNNNRHGKPDRIQKGFLFIMQLRSAITTFVLISSSRALNNINDNVLAIPNFSTSSSASFSARIIDKHLNVSAWDEFLRSDFIISCLIKSFGEREMKFARSEKNFPCSWGCWRVMKSSWITKSWLRRLSATLNEFNKII